MKLIFYTVFISLLFLPFTVTSQSLIINEMSNGASGSKEYMEFLVIPGATSVSCNPSTPPCLDLRSWMFDDNNGDHGPDGNAAGAFRFSQNTLWSCVPVGTLIVVYNDLDIEASIPAIDLSISDGNFKLVIPISSTLFENRTTSTASIPCTYPTTGWSTTDNLWTKIALANSSDCGRIVNAAGCEVFSVCYGTSNINPMIYFSGNGGQKVFSYQDGIPTSTSNWLSGSADPSPSNQTPGVGNSTLNLAYLNIIRNAASGSVNPVIATATSINASCSCTGSGLASASGSSAPYTYQWLTSSFNSTGQNSANAINLCAGTYNVIVTSNVGCKDTATITITAPGNNATILANNQSICVGETATLTASPTNSGGTFSWQPGGETTQSITVSPLTSTVYNVTYVLSGCSSTAQSNVAVNSKPIAIITTTDTLSGEPTLLVGFDNSSSNANSYEWNFGNNTSLVNTNLLESQIGIFPNPGMYTVVLTAINGGCKSFDTLKVVVTAFLEPIYVLPNIFTPNDDKINDAFFIDVKNAKSIKVEIVNRWGEKVGQINDFVSKWDGKDATDGVYFYTYEILSLNNEKIKGQAFLQLVR